MRYESIPRKISNVIKSLYKTMVEQFGTWLTWAILVGFAVLLYRPVKKYFDVISMGILYIVLGGVALYILYYFIRKIFR